MHDDKELRNTRLFFLSNKVLFHVLASYNEKGDGMRHTKRILLGIGMVCTLMIATVYMSRFTHIVAEKEWRVLNGIVVVLDPGHGGDRKSVV